MYTSLLGHSLEILSLLFQPPHILPTQYFQTLISKKKVLYLQQLFYLVKKGPYRSLFSKTNKNHQPTYSQPDLDGQRLKTNIFSRMALGVKGLVIHQIFNLVDMSASGCV